MNWDEYFIRMAMHVASKSKDDSTKIGVVVVRENTVLATGYNGFPRGVAETLAQLKGSEYENELLTERWHQRPDKYRWVEHGERNAIYQAARQGHGLNGATMYCNFHGLPCSDCTRAIIQAGIREVVIRAEPAGHVEGEGVGKHYHCGDIEQTMLDEGGVVVRRVADFAPEYSYRSPFRNPDPGPFN